MNKNPYDKNYFDYYGSLGLYDRSKEEWLLFFASIADGIKETISWHKETCSG